MNKFSFGTKAEVLKILYENCEKLDAKVLKPSFFTVGEWNKDAEMIIQRLSREFYGSRKVIVRSSAKSEDSEKESLAGMYESYICSNDESSIMKAVGKVIASYGDYSINDQVLVQEAMEEVGCSGVVFSREPNAGGVLLRY